MQENLIYSQANTSCVLQGENVLIETKNNDDYQPYAPVKTCDFSINFTVTLSIIALITLLICAVSKIRTILN